MSYEFQNENELRQWEQEHSFRIRWKCPNCSYNYEAERYVNEAIECPTCRIKTEECGESYDL